MEAGKKEAERKIVKVQCPECGGGYRNHRVRSEVVERWSDDDSGESGAATYQVCQCQGCETVRFRLESWCSADFNPHTGEPDTEVRVYPEHVAGTDRRQALFDEIDDEAIPAPVDRIYRETVEAFNAGTMILAGAGLRAIVEAICIQSGVLGRNLQEKIDALVAKNLLAQPQADLLHEERYLGNAAIHEMEPPSRRDLEDGLTIVETILNTLYVVPIRAERLREKRAKKAAKVKGAA